MQIPLLTNELANRLEQVDEDVLRGRLQAAQQREGNPMGVEMRRFGSVTAFKARKLPNTDFNRVMGIGEEQIECVEEIMVYYEDGGLPYGLDIVPSRASETLLSELGRRGFAPMAYHTSMYASPDRARAKLLLQEAERESVFVREVRADEEEMFAELCRRGFGLSTSSLAGNAENNRALLQDPQWKLYFVVIDDTPAGLAMMHLHPDGVAGFALAATLPEFRGRGGQTALLQRRMLDAADAGCHLVVAQCEFGSTSFLNMQKAGMHVAFTKTEWRSVR